MAGIYLHIPFCRKACVYCDFHFVTSMKRRGEMVEAIMEEAQMRADFFESSSLIQTIYLGGGTPSVLSAEELNTMLEGLGQLFPQGNDVELTLEANPDDLSDTYLKTLHDIGINRLSIGTQSFRDADLIWMNRSHDASQAIQSVETAQQVGITNLSLDLIFGLPKLSMDAWQANLEQAIELDIPHLSVYALTVEDRTALDAQVKKGMTRVASDEQYRTQFLLAHDLLTAAGYVHYELSNYAKSGQHSIHNSNYWNHVPYLGLGPSAHGFDGGRRYWNHANNSHYLKAIAEKKLPQAGEEQLSSTDHYHEYLMTHLRRECGIDLSRLQQWVPDWELRFASLLEAYQTQGLMHLQDNQYILSPEGWIISDQITASFFLE